MVIESPVLLSSYARCGQERSFAFVDPVDEVVAAAAGEVRPALSGRPWRTRIEMMFKKSNFFNTTDTLCPLGAYIMG